MNASMRNALCATVILALPAIAAAGDDLTLTSKVTRADGKTTTAVTYLSAEHARMATGDGKESLVDARTGLMTSIDTIKKTYYVTTREDMDRLMAGMQEHRNSPEMQKAQAAMQKHAGMYEFSVKKSGVSKKIAGYRCEVWTISVGQMSTNEQCLSNDLQTPTPVWDMYNKYSRSMRSSMASMGSAGSNAKIEEQMKNMTGYPLWTQTTIDIMGHKTVVGSEVTDVRRGPIPASTWAIPAGYTKVDNPLLKAFAHAKS